MCLAALSIGQSERFPFVLASNRDEFFARASAPLAWWRPPVAGNAVLSGRDLAGGGTWLGLDATGRLALVTNVREPGRHLPAAPSRGALVLQWLADASARAIELAQAPRNGFNLLTVDLRRARAARDGGDAVGEWISNRPAVQHRVLRTGSFGLSNASLDTPWPKVVHLRRRLTEAVARDDQVDDLVGLLFTALRDRRPAPDFELPRTGVPLDRERLLSSAFIRIGTAAAGAVAPGGFAAYGTRCSTVVVVETRGRGLPPSARAPRPLVHVLECSYDESGQEAGMRVERFELAQPL